MKQNLEFQENLLKYMIQQKDSRKYIPKVDKDLFADNIYQFLFNLFKEYLKDYKYTPAKANFHQYFLNKVPELGISKELQKEVTKKIEVLYEPLDADTFIYDDTIRLYVQRTETKNMLVSKLDQVNSGDSDFFSKLSKEMNNIAKISEEGLIEENEQTRGVFLLQDFEPINPNKRKGYVTPTNLKMLNRLTSSRGFKTPELVVIMSGPKGFKTGLMINLLKGFVADGKKVLYADFENGVENIRTRVLQSMGNLTKQELESGDYNDELNYLVSNYMSMGGEMRIEYFPQGVSNLTDVENKLDELKEEHNWIPDIIVYDYLDLAGCADRSIKEKRLQIQYNYHHAIRINNKYGTFSITPSQISKEAWKQMKKNRYIDMTSFSEDYGKAMNCHAAFAICRTTYDEENNAAFLIPIVQREGLRFREGIECPLEFDEQRQQVIEPNIRGIPTHLEYFEAALDPKKGFYWAEDSDGRLAIPMIGKRFDNN